MICCEGCEAWQHNECMEMSEDDDELPDNYYCEQCRPQDHVELLRKIKNGEKPWEERAKQREEEEQGKKGRRKKGKKGGRKPRQSEVRKEEIQENGAMDIEPDTTQQEEPSEIVQSPPPEPESNKRKLPEDLESRPKSPSQTVSPGLESYNLVALIAGRNLPLKHVKYPLRLLRSLRCIPLRAVNPAP